VRRAAPDRSHLRRGRRFPRDACRQRHARRRAAGVRPGRDRLRDLCRPGGERGPPDRPGAGAPGGRSPHGPGRRAGHHRPQAHAGGTAPVRGRSVHPHVHPPPLPRRHRRARSGERGHRRAAPRGPGGRGGPARREWPDGHGHDRAPHRDLRRRGRPGPGGGHPGGGAGRDHPHCPQADGRSGVSRGEDHPPAPSRPAPAHRLPAPAGRVRRPLPRVRSRRPVPLRRRPKLPRPPTPGSRTWPGCTPGSGSTGP
jgi:hypothetical protein